MPTNRLMRLQGVAERTARALLRRTDVAVQVAGSGAHYNWKTRTLTVPDFQAEPDDPKLVPAWRGILDHECAHVLFTDFEAGDAAIQRWRRNGEAVGRLQLLWNGFEDPYVERCMMRDFPGSRVNIHAQREYAVAKAGDEATDPEFRYKGAAEPIGVFGAFVQAVLRLGLGLIEMRNVHPATRFLIDRCLAEIQQGHRANSTAEAITAAELVWAKLRDLSDDVDDGSGDGDDADDADDADDGDGSGDGADDADDADDGDGDDAGSGDGDDADDGDDGDGSGDGDDADDGDGSGDGSGDGDDSGSGDGGDSAGAGDGAREAGPGSDLYNHSPNSKRGSHAPGYGAGFSPSAAAKTLAEASGGQFVALPGLNEMVAEDFAPTGSATGDLAYTVNPEAALLDEVVTFDAGERAKAKERARSLREAVGPKGRRLASYFEGAFRASRMCVRVGGMEEGAYLDPDALPGFAVGVESSRIFARDFRGVDESVFVTVLVDCSGSMGSSQPLKGRDGPVLASKAAHAAATAVTLHDALRACRVPHAVLGFTTKRGVGPRGLSARRKWSRTTDARRDFIFVPAPGLDDPGDALPYITGYSNNLDGESVQWAAEYAAKHGADADRIILLVVSDGLPAGADDDVAGAQHLTRTVDRVARAQIEVYGIGVGVSYYAHRYAEFYPQQPGTNHRAATGHVLLDTAEGLTDRILRDLRDLITRGFGTSRKTAFGG